MLRFLIFVLLISFLLVGLWGTRPASHGSYGSLGLTTPLSHTAYRQEGCMFPGRRALWDNSLSFLIGTVGANVGERFHRMCTSNSVTPMKLEFGLSGAGGIAA